MNRPRQRPVTVGFLMKQGENNWPIKTYFGCSRFLLPQSLRVRMKRPLMTALLSLPLCVDTQTFAHLKQLRLVFLTILCMLSLSVCCPVRKKERERERESKLSQWKCKGEKKSQRHSCYTSFLAKGENVTNSLVHHTHTANDGWFKRIIFLIFDRQKEKQGPSKMHIYTDTNTNCILFCQEIVSLDTRLNWTLVHIWHWRPVRSLLVLPLSPIFACCDLATDWPGWPWGDQSLSASSIS